eukprot:g8533.t1
MFDLHRGSLVGEEFAQESSSRFRSSTASSESSASSDDTGFVRKTGRDRDGTKIGLHGITYDPSKQTVS